MYADRGIDFSAIMYCVLILCLTGRRRRRQGWLSTVSGSERRCGYVTQNIFTVAARRAFGSVLGREDAIETQR